MPTCRRKRVVLTEPPESLVQAVKRDPNKDVFYLPQTGEIFETYDAYAARMSFYRLKQFQCEVTGKSGLDFFQALESERQEARTLHARFSESLKGPILKAVQYQVMGRLDHLVEAVYERFRDRYFKDERVLVELSGVKYYAKVEKVYPPKYVNDPDARDAHKDVPFDDSPSGKDKPHVLGGNLKFSVKDAVAKDDPNHYFYWVHVIELERDKSRESKAMAAKAEKDMQMVGSLMEVQCGMLSRDRLSFSKSILRRFIRDCVDRAPTANAPWIVKPSIGEKYGVDPTDPEEAKKKAQAKKAENEKRKKANGDKDGPPLKKQKKAKEDRAEREEREAKAKKEEAERKAAEKKKKAVRYPTEDLDVRINDRDKKAGLILKRPNPERLTLPFNDSDGTFEHFLHAWNFLVVYGQPLHISAFTLDELEHAIRHPHYDPPCPLLAEVHSTLIYNLRTVPFQRHSAVLSLLQARERLQRDPDSMPERVMGISLDELTDAIVDVGNNWERVPLRHSEVRDGWEEAMVGCLKDHATLQNFPRLREIMTKLLFGPEAPADQPQNSAASSSSRASSLVNSQLAVLASPLDRYYTLSFSDRIAILSFMCNVAVSSKAIHMHMETCEEQLTALRKEKIEVNRNRKQCGEDLAALTTEDQKPEDTQTPAAEASAVEGNDMSGSEAGSEGPSANGKKGSAKKSLQQKVQQNQHAKTSREAARAKQASEKQAAAERRRLEEDIAKHERRLEGIEREFRKLLGSVRVKPLGRDRFFNRVWWFDGLGSSTLVGSGGVPHYGTGRLFLQGPSEFDLELLNRKRHEDPSIQDRQLEEEGPNGQLGPGEWATYADVEQLEEFLSWLNPKGNREVALKSALTKWWPHITAGMRKRITDVNNVAKLPEARRSARGKVHKNDISREPYMQWTNRRAVNVT